MLQINVQLIGKDFRGKETNVAEPTVDEGSADIVIAAMLAAGTMQAQPRFIGLIRNDPAPDLPAVWAHEGEIAGDCARAVPGEMLAGVEEAGAEEVMDHGFTRGL